MLELFAQVGRNNNFGGGGGGLAAGGQNPDELKAVLIAIAGGTCVVLIVMLIVVIMFLIMLSKALGKCRPGNRTMEPGMVWLNFVPCLNIVWQFLTVVRVASSLKNEFRSRGIDRGETYGLGLGLSVLILNIVIAIVSRMLSTAGEVANDMTLIFASLGVSLVGQLVVVILFIMYWVKIAGYSRQLDETKSYGSDRDRYGDDDYDRPRRRDDGDDDLPRGGGYGGTKDNDPRDGGDDDKPWRRS